MHPSLWVGKTGLDAQQTRLTAIANNLANVSTTGFKRNRIIFEDLLYQNVRQVGAQATQDTQLPSGLLLGTGVRVTASVKLHSQGNLVQTENPLDLAIQGRGYFQILRPDGSIGYTRDGSFQVDSDGQVVTASGDPIEPAITIPSDAVSITVGSDGTVSVLTAGSTTPTTVGNVELADFINPAGLEAIGENLFLESAASGAPTTGTPGLDGLGSLVQGAVESSNVNAVEELVNMIETQRAYEMNSKVISTTDQMLAYVNNNL